MSVQNQSLEYAEKFAEVRNEVTAALKDVTTGTVYEEDVQRLNTDDVYLQQFIKHKRGDVTEATNMIVDAFKWRKEFGVRDVVESSICGELWQKGTMYFHNHDIDGHRTMYINVARRRKGEFPVRESHMLLIYLLERANVAAPDRPVTVIMDFTGAGLTSVDIEFTKFMINCFKYYFPYFLNVLVNYEMPWLFNAAWKIIKTFLDEDAIKKVKFEGRKTIQQYITVDQLAEHMGGTDKFQYVYEPAAVQAAT